LREKKHGGAEPGVSREETTAAKSSRETAPLSTRKLSEEKFVQTQEPRRSTLQRCGVISERNSSGVPATGGAEIFRNRDSGGEAFKENRPSAREPQNEKTDQKPAA
jgi:hypothetical protein